MPRRLERARLIASLRGALAGGPVLLVAAAGYGKTTLLEQALRRPGCGDGVGHVHPTRS